jgi:hypothetical protein
MDKGVEVAEGKPATAGRVVALAAGISALATLVVLLVAAEPAGAIAWNLSPYAGLVAVGLISRSRWFRLGVAAASILFGLWGTTALVDGLLLRAGVFVDPDIDTSHLVAVFLPMHLWLWLAFALLAVGTFRAAQYVCRAGSTRRK